MPDMGWFVFVSLFQVVGDEGMADPEEGEFPEMWNSSVFFLG